MKLLKQLFIWVLVMTFLSLFGTVARYFFMDSRIPDSAMILAAASGVVMGIAIGLVRYLKQRRAEAAKN